MTLDFIRRHALPLVLLIVLGVVLMDCAGTHDRLERAEVYEDSARVYRGQLEVLERDTARLNQERREAAARSDSLLAIVDSLEAATPDVLVRWRTLPDTATVATVRAAADSTIRHLTDVGDHWRRVAASRMGEIDALEAQNTNLHAQLEAVRGEARTLAEANAELREAAESRPSVLIPAAFIVTGATVWGAFDGLEGVAKGAMAGVGGSILYLGTRELLRVEVSLPWPF